ncbi:hypothetical protein QN277_026066 [Acacia crassicarpa]|uniref:Uncharacterized protein n=1 Tax=Acacia crassicarpa TaxID=499986 RepID=A0AAE1MH03_9FABA|nr:hypothetical protein QN277_026066 [Acacia crassicarpa]
MSYNGAVTGVECHKQVRSWRLLHSLMQLLIPTCNSPCLLEQRQHYDHNCNPSWSSPSSIISGTIFGYRHGRANLCIQEKPSSSTPLVLLHLPLPTTVLAKQMKGGTLRMVLQSVSNSNNNNIITTPTSCCSCCCSTVLSPLWILYCNGKKQGYAVKRRPSNVDMEVLRSMRKVAAGAGIMRGKKKMMMKKKKKKLNGEDDDHEVLYLRANFRRVRSESTKCESFHLIDPEGSIIGEELSVFFFG